MTKQDFVFVHSQCLANTILCVKSFFIENSDNTINFAKTCLAFFKASKNSMHYVYSNQECKNESKSTM
jgi:hypothetical protein